MRGNKTKDEMASGILALIKACRIIVEAWDSGQVSPPVLARRTRNVDIRTVPHYKRGFDSASKDILYTTHSITEYLYQAYGKDLRSTTKGKGFSNRWLLLAMLLLEKFETGELDEQETLAHIQAGDPGYRMNQLLKRLRNN